MFSFKKLANKKILSANIQLNLGKSPTQYSISISPPKPRNTNKPFTSYDFNKANDEYYNSFYKQAHPNIPNPSLMTEIKLFTNKLKKKLFTKKQKPVDLDLGKSSSSHKNKQKQHEHFSNSIGGNKITNKPSTKKFNKPTKKSTKKIK
jgi:hypothetical protein